MTYVNHIELGVGWKSFGDVSDVLRLAAGPGRRDFLPEPEMILMNASYVMPDNRGRLHVAAQPAVRRPDGREVLQLTLTARGKPASSELQDIMMWLDLGHEWIVHGFADITTAAMHEQVWRRL